MENCHQGRGIVVYDPPRLKMKRKTINWCVIEVDREITRYYRWWVQHELHIKLYEPSWDAHCSCIRGEVIKEPFIHKWRKYHGETVPFVYQHNVRRSGDTVGSDRPNHFWFVEVKCSMIDQIRSELGLNSFFKYHLTIGRTY